MQKILQNDVRAQQSTVDAMKYTLQRDLDKFTGQNLDSALRRQLRKETSTKLKENAELIRYFTGFSELDSLTDGFANGELVVVTGLFGNGKTTFCQSLIKQFSCQGIQCTVFPFEGSAMKFFEAFKKEGILTNPIFVPETNKAGDYSWIEERIIESKIKHDSKIFLIDHLHYIIDMGAQHLNIDIGQVMRRLALLAELENIVIFIVCHQKGLHEFKVEPSLSLCRDSSAIPQECSTGIVVHRTPDLGMDGEPLDSYDQGYAFVKIDKARRSGTYRKKITFQMRGRWLEPL
jgi:replicative DNA helicase